MYKVIPAKLGFITIAFALLAFFSPRAFADEYYWHCSAAGAYFEERCRKAFTFERVKYKSPASICETAFSGPSRLLRIDNDEMATCDTFGVPFAGFTFPVWRGGDECKYAFDNQAKECIDKNKGLMGCTAGTNPINIFTGYKFQPEFSYISQRGGASFSWVFNGVLGDGKWLHNYQSTIITFDYPDFLLVLINRSNDSELRFTGTLATGWSADSDIGERLFATDDGAGSITGWELTLENDIVEEYDSTGRLLSITDQNGLTQVLTYNTSTGLLETVTDSLGNSLSFAYDAARRVITMTDPEGGVYNYAYDANSMLSSVTYPDDTPGSSADNPRRIYHYEDANFPQTLTGISDENGNRFATWAYDTQGRAISSEHANGAEKVTLDYTHIDDANDPRVTVTNELGKQTTYHYTTIHGVRKVTQVEGHQSANCAAANQSYTYDANGFKDEVTDWEGNVTDYDHDARGLEVQRIEAKGTPQQRIITTQWHADFRLPVKITEPDRVIYFSYGTQGLLLERKETPVP